VAQKQGDKGKGAMRPDMRTGGHNDNVVGGAWTQTEATIFGKGGVAGDGSTGRGGDAGGQGEGSRAYRQEAQRGPGPTQVTLSDMWKAKDNALRSWTEEMESRMHELETDRQRSRSMSYV
jgi:hypothetical protein